VEANVNPQLAASRNADIALLFSPLPANFRQLYGWGILGTASALAAAGRLNGLSGAGDTTDFTAKGTEIEIRLQPDAQLAHPDERRQTGIDADQQPAVSEAADRLMTPVWDQLRDRPRLAYPVGWQPTDPLPVPAQLTYGDYLDANVTVPVCHRDRHRGLRLGRAAQMARESCHQLHLPPRLPFGEKLKGSASAAPCAGRTNSASAIRRRATPT
jgi:hypothetical protein